MLYLFQIIDAFTWASLVAHRLKASACSVGDLGSIPGSGRSPGERNGNPLEYSCLESDGERSLAGYIPWGHRVRHDWRDLARMHSPLLKSSLYCLSPICDLRTHQFAAVPFHWPHFTLFHKAEMILLHFLNFFLCYICVYHCFPICLNAVLIPLHLFFPLVSVYFDQLLGRGKVGVCS